MQMHLVPLVREMDRSVARSTVLGDVVQRFLRDAVQAKRHTGST